MSKVGHHYTAKDHTRLDNDPYSDKTPSILAFSGFQIKCSVVMFMYRFLFQVLAWLTWRLSCFQFNKDFDELENDAL